MRTLIAITLFAYSAGLVEAAPVLSIISGAPDARSVRGSTHGWQFKANAPIVVTHLGLFDFDNDGFQRNYPIGIFDWSDEVLLTSGIVSAGIGDPLIDRFRYVDTPDIRLTVGREYVIAWHTPDIILSNSTEFHFHTFGEFSISPVITRTANSRFNPPTDGLVLPKNSDGDDHQPAANSPPN